MPLCRLSRIVSERAPSKTTLTVTSKSFRKTDRLLIRSSAQVGLAVPRTLRAAMARRVWRRELAKRVSIRQPGHYSRVLTGPFHEVRAAELDRVGPLAGFLRQAPRLGRS